MKNDTNELILKLLLLMAFADNVYMEEEKELITDISNELGLDSEKANEIFAKIQKIEDITKECRKTANKIKNKQDREKVLDLLSKMITADKIVHKAEIFALQLIAEEWDMYRKKI